MYFLSVLTVHIHKTVKVSSIKNIVWVPYGFCLLSLDFFLALRLTHPAEKCVYSRWSYETRLDSKMK